jgi:two-component system NtrC family sensor kinase
MSAGPAQAPPTAALSGEPGDAPLRRSDSTRRRPRRRLTWPLRGLLAGSLAVPALLLALAAWQNFRLVQHQAEERVIMVAGELDEHDLGAFRIYPMVLGWIAARVRGEDWDQIERDPDLQRFLAELETLPQIDAVRVLDASGRIRAGGRGVSASGDLRLASDDAFIAQQRRDSGVFVGREHIDPLTHDRVFDVSQRLTRPDGGFAGAVVVSAEPRFFRDFYGRISNSKGLVACLLRTDGAVLVRYPDSAAPGFEPHSRFLTAIEGAAAGAVLRATSPLDGKARIYVRYRLAGFPVDVVYGVPERAVLPFWRANLASYLLFAVPASLALFAVTWLATRRIQRERIASWRWQTTARRLRREINRRAQTEAELRQSQKIEALGQLTGGVAHDFNNLLAVLQGCLEILSGRQADDRLQRRVDLALETVARGERLTRRLLAFARRGPAAVEALDLNAQLREMTELLARTAGGGIVIETDLAEGLWPIDADPTQIELVVINLAINARDAMPNGGTLRIRTANRSLPAETAETAEAAAPAREFVELAISDTGTGMPPDVAERALEPFFTTKEPGKGTGLGLSMIDEFARRAGGAVAIASEIGHGTTVTLHLPRSRGAAPRAEGLPANGAA